MRVPNCVSIIVAAALALSPGLAVAHAMLASATPAANATVTKPAKIELAFNQNLIGPTVKVELFMTAMPMGMLHGGGMDHAKMGHGKMDHGGMVEHAPAKIAATSQLGKDGKSVMLTPRRALSAGKYKVSWSAAGADRHQMSGSYSFTVK
jgi:copper resistance protein C